MKRKIEQMKNKLTTYCQKGPAYQRVVSFGLGLIVSFVLMIVRMILYCVS